MNLIKNSSFEGDVESGEWYVHQNGCGKFPTFWRPYWTEERDPDKPWQNARPEYGYPELGDAQWEYRRRSGDKSFGWGADWHTHKGGSYRQISVPNLVGKRVRFSVWGYYLVGGDGSDNPEHPGRVYDCVGIGPSGEQDGFTDTIIWSEPLENVIRGYETKPIWKQHIVETEVHNDLISIFLHTAPEWAGIRTSGPVWDDAVLEIMEDSHCRGLPRIDYKRVVNVTPDEGKAHEILTKTWPQTISNSYDDAGLGDLNDKTAVLWDIAGAKHQDYLDFYELHYPGTQVEFKYTDDWIEPSNWDQYLLWQGDPQWGDVTFGPGNCTMKNTACFITSLAMAQRVYEIDEDATPLTVDAALTTAGYAQPCNALWSAITEKLGMTIASSTKTQADAHINAGGVMLIEVLPAEMQHFVLAVEVLGDDNYLILDPYKNVVAPLKDHYPGWESWRMIAKNEGPGPGPTPSPDNGPQLPHRDSLIGLHLQTRMEGDEAYIRQLGTGVVKCFSFEDAAYFRAVNPDVITSVRMYTKEQHIGGDPAIAATRYIATFYDALIKHHGSTDYIESWNETIGSSDREANKWFAEFHKHFTYGIDALDLHTKACILNTAVGNPLSAWVIDLIPAARAAYETGGTIGCHGYWWCNPSVDGIHEMVSWWPYHAGRMLEGWDPVFRAHGIYPNYIIGEAGVVGSSDGYSLNAHAGWRSRHTLKADWGRYFAQIAHFQANLREWNALHGNRCLGATIFTSGAPYVGWESFIIAHPEMESLATLS